MSIDARNAVRSEKRSNDLACPWPWWSLWTASCPSSMTGTGSGWFRCCDFGRNARSIWPEL